jgi:pimeloyl-ACP methyl ester carboxylesterase
MFLRLMSQLDPVGAEHVMRTTLTSRAPITDLEKALRDCQLPILVMIGDQDTPAEEACRFIAKQAPHSGLAVLPNCGHTLNLEEPAMFNQLVADFLVAVSAGRWGTWIKN